MKVFSAELEGRTALLMHRWSENAEVAPGTRNVHVVNADPRVEAERYAYRRPDGVLYLPGAAPARLLREAGGAHKQRGSRKSMKYVVPAAVLVIDDVLPLTDANDELLTEFEVDSRPVTIPATKGRIMRHRPRLNEWRVEVSLEIDETLIDPALVHQLLTEGGRSLGLGDYRPEKGGPFGRFSVIGWREIGD